MTERCELAFISKVRILLITLSFLERGVTLVAQFPAVHTLWLPQLAYQQLVTKIRNEKRKRELAFLLSIPVFSQLARFVGQDSPGYSDGMCCSRLEPVG